MKILRMGVDPAGLAFGLDKMSHELHPQQYLRELAQNGIEAVLRTASGTGEVVWDVAPMSFADASVEKLCCIDNGVGMSADELIEYINQGFRSGKDQGHEANFGIGAKVAGLTFNKAGLLYLSWKDGAGSMVHLIRDGTSGEYGLAQLRLPDGSYGYSAPVGDEHKPSQIDAHGTMVVLLGNADAQDTFAAPPDAAGQSYWIAAYLTNRYFTIPEGVVLRARDNATVEREGSAPYRPLRTVRGQKRALQMHAHASGTVELSDALAHWWLMPPRDEATKRSGVSGVNVVNGHTAALYASELYEWLPLAKGAAARLQNFGILVGGNRVVLYVEPLALFPGEVEPNLTRTRILMGRQPLPWSRWASEFAEKMPAEISQMMDSIFSGASTTDYDRTIRKRLAKIRELLDVHRWRDDPQSADKAEEDTQGGEPRELGGVNEDNGKQGGLGGLSAAIYKLLRSDDGEPAKKKQTQSRYPKVVWVTLANGRRMPGDLEGRAARYVPVSNTILANGDFVGFEQVADLISRELHAPRGLIKEIARLEYETVLTETVMSMLSFEGSREWSKEEVHAALSEAALTTAVMSRFHIYQSVRRDAMRKAKEAGKERVA